MNIHQIPSPAYVLEEKLLRRNLSLIRSVQEQAPVEILLAFKAFALWKSFSIFKEYGFSGTTSSSINEAQMAFEEMGSLTHAYAPAYTDADFPLILKYSKHVTFNSIAQYVHFRPMIQAFTGHPVSCGLRINPEYSPVETDLYNPCAPGSRLGILADQLGNDLPEGIEGLHFHCLCESGAEDLVQVLCMVEKKFGHFLPKLRWLNMGGGHLMTRKDYQVDYLIKVLNDFQRKYPHLHLIMEPGSAFTWQTGALYAKVVDVVENKGIKTAILNVSFACHMPDCLEMPYKPVVRYASLPDEPTYPYRYRLGGNSCLAGDFIGDWTFPAPLETGDDIIFEDMIHYTTVKTHTFNGVPHPSICFMKEDGQVEIWRQFAYSDYKNRMD